MKIALVGYGKMGKRIDELATRMGHEVAFRISSSSQQTIHDIINVDVAIEFTNPESAVTNLTALAQNGIPTVTGTTGWMNELDTVSAAFEATGTPLFYASNFSVGVFVTRALTEKLATIMNGLPDYAASIDEWHHIHKKDSPSGTALSLAEDVIEHHEAYTSVAPDRAAEDNSELPVKGFREAEVPGTHTVRFESEIDKIEITHEAKSRDGFVLGAIQAAQFAAKQPAGIYTMKDLIKLSI